jgi:Glu-tRNA(Gln) amidotransferase subunit E-like FAD-binding protein
VEKIIRAKQKELNITDASKKGMLMSGAMKDLKGKADGAVVKEIVDSLF